MSEKKAPTAKKPIVKAKTLSLEAIQEAMKSNPDLAKQVASIGGGDGSVGDLPKHTIEEGYCLTFPDGPPNENIRGLLKKSGYTFRRNDKRWIGPKAGLMGTPFQPKE